MNTSKRISWPEKPMLLQRLNKDLRVSRYLASGLFLMASILSIVFLGLGSGIFASVVMLMTVGCLAVLFFPFRYVGLRGIALLFVVCFVLELLF